MSYEEAPQDPAVEAYTQAHKEGRVNADGSIRINVSSQEGQRTPDQEDAIVRRVAELESRLSGAKGEEKEKILKELEIINKF